MQTSASSDTLAKGTGVDISGEGKAVYFGSKTLPELRPATVIEDPIVELPPLILP